MKCMSQFSSMQGLSKLIIHGIYRNQEMSKSQLLVKIIGPVAQWITRLTTDQKIPGSNPGRFEIFCLSPKFCTWQKSHRVHRNHKVL